MRLEKLTEDKLVSISDKRICCYEKSTGYLQELCDRYDILDRITCIIDDNPRKQGKCEICGTMFNVYSSACLQEINWSETILLITSDYYMEAYERIAANEKVCEFFNTIYYFINLETEYEEKYLRKYENTPLQNAILFRSGPHSDSYVKGMDFTDNSRALFEYMLQNNYNKYYKLIWLVKNPSEFNKWKVFSNVEFISFDWGMSEKQEERDKYYQVLYTVKYIFFTDAYGFARNCRRDQIRVQLWHGCGYKTRVNFDRCENRYEYTTVISDLYSQIHQVIYGLRADQMLVTGYAKEDWLFHPTSKDYKNIFNIPKASKYVFWLPTFRMADKRLSQLNEYRINIETGLPIVESVKELRQLNDFLNIKDIVLIIKLHPFQDRSVVYNGALSNIVMLDSEELFDNDIQINELLGEADALVSDYSSAAVDYLLLDRPMGFTLDDVQEYKESRGFVFENIKEWLPGKEIYSYEDLCDFFVQIANEQDPLAMKRHELRQKMHKYHDDQNCKRIVEVLGISI